MASVVAANKKADLMFQPMRGEGEPPTNKAAVDRAFRTALTSPVESVVTSCDSVPQSDANFHALTAISIMIYSLHCTASRVL